ncbi:MAG TPA: chemotaxis protein CheW [Geomonas sp.]|nr:chemotaxis protein CheW [Geomonas sp.]
MAEEIPVYGRRATDWSELLKRQQAAAEAVSGHAPSAEQEQATLLARAARLARRPAGEAAERRLECLEFLLSGERYAVELSYVSQTLPLTDYTPLFCTPPFVLGITHLRGRIVSIVDLRRFFELPALGLSDLNRVIVVGNGSVEFGILADEIHGVASLAAASLKPPPDAFTGIREEFLAGVSADRLALLDMAKILADRRVIVHEEVG